MKKAESMLRQTVREKLNGVCHTTWIENGKVGPGTPDLMFVFPGNYETGWMELKAEFKSGDNAKSVKFEVRAEQHTWIEKFGNHVPVMLLCQWGEIYYLIEGKYHKHLHHRLSPTDLVDISMAAGAGNWLRHMLVDNLQEVTDRFRNVE